MYLLVFINNVNFGKLNKFQSKFYRPTWLTW